MTGDAVNAFLQKLNPSHIRKNAPLREYNTFMTGGQASLLLTPDTPEELVDAIALCRETGVRYVIIGRGSNVLFSEGMFDAAVIVTTGLKALAADPGDHTLLRAQAGVLLKHLSAQACKNGLTGLEFACGIPGTAGGALRMNAGAYGGDMASVFHSARVLTDTGEIITLDKNSMAFGYRKSALSGESWVVLETELRLSPGDTADIQARMDENMEARNRKQPVSQPSAGSVFKRPMEGVSAAGLIEACGLKGRSVGGAQVSPKHSGFIVNTGGATTNDVKALISLVQAEVYEKKGVMLQTEIVFIE